MSVDFGSKLVCGYKVPKNLLQNYDNMTEAIKQLTEEGYWHRASYYDDNENPIFGYVLGEASAGEAVRVDNIFIAPQEYYRLNNTMKEAYAKFLRIPIETLDDPEIFLISTIS